MWKGIGAMLLSMTASALLAQSDVRWFTVTPEVLGFTAVNPASGTAPISISADWRVRFGSESRPWSLMVQAAGTTVQNCPKVPLSAFRITCDSLDLPNGATGSCSGGGIVLSASPQILASGLQAPRNKNYGAHLTALFLDSWRYPGSQLSGCSISLVYTVDAL